MHNVHISVFAVYSVLEAVFIFKCIVYVCACIVYVSVHVCVNVFVCLRAHIVVFIYHQTHTMSNKQVSFCYIMKWTIILITSLCWKLY